MDDPSDSVAPKLSSVLPVAGGWVRGLGGLSALRLTFSEAISTPPSGSIRAFIGGAFPSPIALSVAPGTGANEWLVSFNTPVNAGLVTLVVDYTVTDLAGNGLDGEVSSPDSASLPSGDGFAGGQTVLRFNVLEGDVNQDGVVDANDLGLILDAFDTANAAADLNGNGIVDSDDVGAVIDNFGGTLTPDDGNPPSVVSVTPDPTLPLTAPITQVTVKFNAPVTLAMTNARSLFLINEAGSSFKPADNVVLSGDAKSATYTFNTPIDFCDVYRLGLSASLANPSGTLLTAPAPSAIAISGLIPPIDPSIDSTPAVTATEFFKFTGSAPGAAKVLIVSPAAPIEVPVVNGKFSGTIQLPPDALSTVYFTSISPCGIKSSPASRRISRDASPPSVAIDFPTSGSQLTANKVTVIGRVGDEFSGFAGITVTVNGVPALVNPGGGNNGTFSAPNISINPSGQTTLTVVATDAVGNQRTTSVNVTYFVPTSNDFVMEAVSGDAQSGRVLTTLAQPLTVRLKKPDGSPLPGKLVTFDITRSDGQLRSSLNGAPGINPLKLQVFTDSGGIATAYWRLGSDAGSGNNRVSVTSQDLVGSTFFSASGTPAPANRIVVGDHNYQKAQAGAQLFQPLRAFVTDGDSGNGVGNVPVSFTVTQGDGVFMNGDRTITVPTMVTGHAEVGFYLGLTPGENVIEATFDGNPGLPATFIATGLQRNDSAPTTLEGTVEDNAGRAIGGALITMKTTLQFASGPAVFTLGPKTTDVNGKFVFTKADLPPNALDTDLPAGPCKMLADARNPVTLNGVAKPVWSFPYVGYEMLIVKGATNSLPTPVYLPEMDPRNEVVYDGTKDVILKMAGVDGLEFKVKAGSLTRENNTRPSPADPEVLRLNQVHFDKVPMALPDGTAFPLAWTLQPKNAKFNPPIEVTLPNLGGLPPGSTTTIVQWNNDTASFQTMGTAKVAPDGSVLKTDPGSGITVAGWGGAQPPPPPKGDVDKDPLQEACDLLSKQHDLYKNTGIGGYTAQVKCLSQAVCANAGKKPGDPDRWTGDFVNNVIKDLGKFSTIPGYHHLNPIRPAWLPNAPEVCQAIPADLAEFELPGVGTVGITSTNVCGVVEGFGHHFLFELLPSFASNIWNSDLSDNQIRAQHNGLFDKAIVPCFSEVTDDQGYFNTPGKWVAQQTVPIAASSMREALLETRRTYRQMRDLLVDGKWYPRGPLDLPTLPPRPSEIELRVPELDGPFPLHVTAPSFFVYPGQDIAIRVARSSQDVTAASSGTKYHILAHSDCATISKDGVLHVVYSPSPLECLPTALLVLVSNGPDWGIAQFAVTDTDSDGDMIVDSFELRAGLDPDVYNVPTADADGDGLPDWIECIMLSDPLHDSDSDGDGIGDAAEVILGSDPLDPNDNEPHLNSKFTAIIGNQISSFDDTGRIRFTGVLADGRMRRLDIRGQLFGKDFYGRSEAFSVLPNQSVSPPAFIIRNNPFVDPISIEFDQSQPLLSPGATLQLKVAGKLTNGSTQDLTNRQEGTTYLSTDPTVATVGINGLVTALRDGTVYVLASNDSASAVIRVQVAANVVLTQVTGVVVNPDGSPAIGASVQLEDPQRSTTTDAAGAFVFADVNRPVGSLVSVRASGGPACGTLFAQRINVMPLPGATTDMGVLLLRPTAGESRSPWTQFRGGPGKGGSVQAAGGGAATKLAWRTPGLGSVTPGGITVAEDGSVYFRSNDNGVSRVFRLDGQTGVMLSQSSLLGSSNAGVTLLGNSLLTVTPTSIVELDASTLSTRRTVTNPVFSGLTESPLISLTPNSPAGNYTWYVIDSNRRAIHAVDSCTGSVIWSTPNNTLKAQNLGKLGPLWIDEQGRHVIANFGNTSVSPGVAVADNGNGTFQVVWNNGGPGNFNWFGTGALGTIADRIYVTTFADGGSDVLWAISRDTGQKRWSIPNLNRRNCFGRPAVVGSRIYAGNHNGILFATEDTGPFASVVWEFNASGQLSEFTSVSAFRDTAAQRTYVYAIDQGPSFGTLLVLRDNGTSFTELLRTSLGGTLKRNSFANTSLTLDSSGNLYVGSGVNSGAAASEIYKFVPEAAPTFVASQNLRQDVFSQIPPELLSRQIENRIGPVEFAISRVPNQPNSPVPASVQRGGVASKGERSSQQTVASEMANPSLNDAGARELSKRTRVIAGVVEGEVTSALGTLGGNQTFVNAVTQVIPGDDASTIAIGWSETPDGWRAPFVWTKATGMRPLSEFVHPQDIAFLPDGSSEAMSIDGWGRVSIRISRPGVECAPTAVVRVRLTPDQRADLDGDGFVTLQDLLILRALGSGGISPSGVGVRNLPCDINLDGRVDEADVAEISSRLLTR